MRRNLEALKITKSLIHSIDASLRHSRRTNLCGRLHKLNYNQLMQLTLRKGGEDENLTASPQTMQFLWYAARALVTAQLNKKKCFENRSARRFLCFSATYVRRANQQPRKHCQRISLEVKIGNQMEQYSVNYNFACKQVDFSFECQKLKHNEQNFANHATSEVSGCSRIVPWLANGQIISAQIKGS